MVQYYYSPEDHQRNGWFEQTLTPEGEAFESWDVLAWAKENPDLIFEHLFGGDQPVWPLIRLIEALLDTIEDLPCDTWDVVQMACDGDIDMKGLIKHALTTTPENHAQREAFDYIESLVTCEAERLWDKCGLWSGS